MHCATFTGPPLPVSASSALCGSWNGGRCWHTYQRKVAYRGASVPRASALGSGAGSAGEEQFKFAPEDENIARELKELEGTSMKWAEIPFTSVTEELNAIDEYVKEEEIEETDAWPQFLRGAAYEHWGQPRLALAQYSKIKYAGGLAKVPELWERRAYNSFKIGDMAGANAYFDVSLRLYTEAVGNELHFAHWFNRNFKDFLPKHNGPSSAVQRGICKYCVGMLGQARESFVAAITMREFGVQHAKLWLLASSARSSKEQTAKESDLHVAGLRPREEEQYCDVLREVLTLYVAAGKGDQPACESALSKLEANAKESKSAEALLLSVYLALFHDAFTGNQEKRDTWVKRVREFDGPPSTSDTLNYVYHAAKNNFTSTDQKGNAESAPKL